MKEINERSKRRQADGQSSKVSPSKSQSQGTLERMAHTTVHVWTGRANPATCSAEQGGVVGHDGKPHCQVDMGFLGTAGRDPLFYSHHSNVDRMWHIWSTRLGGGQGITEADWLDTSFVFYDDVKSPRKVRIRFRDVLDTRDLGYTYDAESDKDLPWLRCKISSLVPHGKDSPPRSSSARKAAPVFPLALTKGQVVEVPAVPVPAKDPGKEQLLVIEGIEYDPQINNKFDVVINVAREDAARVGPKDSEYAGSFSAVPSSNAAGGTLVGKFTLALDGVLADLGLAGASAVDIVLVPHTEGEIKLYLPPTIENA